MEPLNVNTLKYLSDKKEEEEERIECTAALDKDMVEENGFLSVKDQRNVTGTAKCKEHLRLLLGGHTDRTSRNRMPCGHGICFGT